MRVVIIVQGGWVQQVLTDEPLDYVIIDHDIQDEDQMTELTYMTGDTFKAAIAECQAEVCEDVEHYYNQIPAM